MSTSNFARACLIGLVFAGLSGPAAAIDEIVVERGWPQVDYAETEDCRAEVRGNGQIYRIAGAGLEPGEVVSFYLTNADIKPVEYRIVANQSGEWVKFYMPFLWNRSGGTVSVGLDSASCNLELDFDWTRQGGGYNSRLAGTGAY